MFLFASMTSKQVLAPHSWELYSERYLLRIRCHNSPIKERLYQYGILSSDTLGWGHNKLLMFYPLIKLSNFGGANSTRLMSAFAFILLKRFLSFSREITLSIICCFPLSKETINPLLPSSTNS